MKKTYHLIAGLPRSGSTLFSAILNQNPRFHSGISSPLEIYLRKIHQITHVEPSWKFIIDDKLENLIESLFDGYYKDIEKEVCFNTGRGWTSYFHVVNKVYPNTKVICTVRDIVEIVNSFEWLHAKNPLHISALFGPFIPEIQNTQNEPVFSDRNVYTRFSHHLHLIEFPLEAMKEMFFGPFKDKMLIVEYKNLCENPKETMQRVYDFLGEEFYEHNFNNLEYNNEKADMFRNTPNMHRVRNKIGSDGKQIILPPELVEKCKGLEFWRGYGFTG